MSTLLTINVKNKQADNRTFYFFQEPAIYKGSSTVYTNSLYSRTVGNLQQTGGIGTFRVDLQYYAGIQEAHGDPVVGSDSGYLSAAQPIDLTPASGSAANFTQAMVDPIVGLSPAQTLAGVEAGAFRIGVPPCSADVTYNIGSAVSVDGGIILSNFVKAQPGTDTDCQPVLKFYVGTGAYTPGTTMNFDQVTTKSALCDFTGGIEVIDVTLNPDGTWQVDTIR